MFALLVIAENWKVPKWISVRDLISALWSVHAKVYITVQKMPK